MIYAVNVSGGLTSFEALRRTIERYGQANTRAVLRTPSLKMRICIAFSMIRNAFWHQNRATG